MTATFKATSIRKGAWRNEQGAQRGSVADMPLYAGDPLTPGVGATKEAKRLPLSEVGKIVRIPVLPDIPIRCAAAAARSRRPGSA